MDTPRPFNALPRLLAAFRAGSVSALRVPVDHPLAAAGVGDRLYARELVRLFGPAGGRPLSGVYAFDGAPVDLSAAPADLVLAGDRQPARYAGRWASRWELTVTKVQRHPLLSLTEADAIAEGIPPAPPRPAGLPRWVAHPTARADRLALWDAEHASLPAADNPEVVALGVVVASTVSEIKTVPGVGVSIEERLAAV